MCSSSAMAKRYISLVGIHCLSDFRKTIEGDDKYNPSSLFLIPIIQLSLLQRVELQLSSKVLLFLTLAHDTYINVKVCVLLILRFWKDFGKSPTIRYLDNFALWCWVVRSTVFIFCWLCLPYPASGTQFMVGLCSRRHWKAFGDRRMVHLFPPSTSCWLTMVDCCHCQSFKFPVRVLLIAPEASVPHKPLLALDGFSQILLTAVNSLVKIFRDELVTVYHLLPWKTLRVANIYWESGLSSACGLGSKRAQFSFTHLFQLWMFQRILPMYQGQAASYSFLRNDSKIPGSPWHFWPHR